MECFKKLLVIFLFCSFELMAQEAVELIQEPTVDRIRPLDQVDIENGEIYSVVVESEKSIEELQAFKNKRINDIMYVLEVRKEFDKKIFKVFVTDPPKKKKDKVDFIPVNFNYNSKNKNVGQEYITFDKKFELNQNKAMSYLWLILAAIGLIGILSFGTKLLVYQRRISKDKQIRKAEALELQDLLNAAKIRPDFEEIYKKRRKILKSILLNEESFEEFLSFIDRVQYKPKWSEPELEEVKTLFKKINIEGIKRGV